MGVNRKGTKKKPEMGGEVFYVKGELVGVLKNERSAGKKFFLGTPGPRSKIGGFWTEKKPPPPPLVCPFFDEKKLGGRGQGTTCLRKKEKGKCGTPLHQMGGGGGLGEKKGKKKELLKGKEKKI